MRQRERHREEAEPQARGGTTSGSDPGLRERAARLLAEVNDVIDSTLSGDSTSFLAATRQSGGQ
jgi:hypothetical protein